jgi:hypothetical protein
MYLPLEMQRTAAPSLQTLYAPRFAWALLLLLLQAPRL